MTTSVEEVAIDQVIGRDEHQKDQTIGHRVAVYAALVEAAEPLTRRDLEFEAHLSEKQVLRALTELQREGLVYQVDNDDDLRRPQYALVDGPAPAEAGGGRARGQVSPLGMVVACGVLYLVVIAVVLVGVAL